MFQVEMTASVRTVTGKGGMRRLRSEGQTPAVMYGAGSEAVMLQLETKVLMKKLLEFYRKNTVVTMKIDNGDTKSVIIKEVQSDPVKDTLVHADFQEIDLDKPQNFSVPVEFVGNAKGVDLGGVAITPFKEIVLEGKPLDIPDNVQVEITSLGIGDAINVGDIAIPESVKLVSDADSVCIKIESTKAEKEAVKEEAVEEEVVEASAE